MSLLDSSSVAYLSVSLIVFSSVTVGSFFALNNEAKRIRKEKADELKQEENTD